LNRNFNNRNKPPRKKEEGLVVYAREGEYFDKMLRRFKKKVDNSGIIFEARSRQEYIKPSERRKKAKAAARSRWMKKVQSEKLPPKRY